MRSCIRILLADDHPVVRMGLSACLNQYEHLAIVGEAADGIEAVTKAKALLPDIALLDIDMPNMSGLIATEVLILSMHQSSDYMLRTLQSGARGYVLKDASTEELVKAIESVDAGETFFSPGITRLALNHFVQGTGDGTDLAELTNREREVLALVAEGFSNKDIASKLGLGVRTVETHREHIMRKLHVHNVAGLTRLAIANGLITVREELAS